MKFSGYLYTYFPGQSYTVIFLKVFGNCVKRYLTFKVLLLVTAEEQADPFIFYSVHNKQIFILTSEHGMIEKTVEEVDRFNFIT
jgi:hypothetical protein